MGLGKLSDAEPLQLNFLGVIERAGYEMLSISVDNAPRAGRLIGAHKDPFDRMIAARRLHLTFR